MTPRLSFLAAFFRVVDGRTLPAKNELANACPGRYSYDLQEVVVKHNCVCRDTFGINIRWSLRGVPILGSGVLVC